MKKILLVLAPLVFFISLISLEGKAQGNLSGTQDSSKSSPAWQPAKLGAPLLRDPIWVYDNWSAYDELADTVPLTEALAMRELNEIIRLHSFGVHFDYYMMNAFWFAPDGAYRTWRRPDWPDGPDRWIAACKANGIQPGLWFGTNSLVKIHAAPQWRDSQGQFINRVDFEGSMSFYEGGFLPDFMKTLQFWYDHGIRMFEFDMADFGAATLAAKKTQSSDEIQAHNQSAFREALKRFRQKNPDIVLVGFNGFGGDQETTADPFPFHHPVDLRWLEVFDSLYSGDPKPSDVPEVNFWRSMDIYSDHMARGYEQSLIPLERIDSAEFFMGDTGTAYHRKTNAWKGMLLLTAARGGWKNTIYGNLEFLDAEKARWFAKVQKMYAPLQALGRTKTFGGIPGEVEPYGFGSVDFGGAIYTVVNPAQAVREIEVPLLSRVQEPLQKGRIIFRDAGFAPILRDNKITLGPGQMVAVGFGRYAGSEFDLGVQEDVRIPRKIAPIDTSFSTKEANTIEATVAAPAKGDLRVIFQQWSKDGGIMRSQPGWDSVHPAPSFGKVIKIWAEQNGKSVPVEIDYDRQMLSGLSWGAGEIRSKGFVPRQPITIHCSSAEKGLIVLQGRVYSVEY
jgi:hypothetical protein